MSESRYSNSKTKEEQLDEFRHLMARRGLRPPVGAYLTRISYRLFQGRSLAYALSMSIVLSILPCFVVLRVVGLGIGEALAAAGVVVIFQQLPTFGFLSRRLVQRIKPSNNVTRTLKRLEQSRSRALKYPEQRLGRVKDTVPPFLVRAWYFIVQAWRDIRGFVYAPLVTWFALLLASSLVHHDVLQILRAATLDAIMMAPFDLHIFFSLALFSFFGYWVTLLILRMLRTLTKDRPRKVIGSFLDPSLSYFLLLTYITFTISAGMYLEAAPIGE